MIPDKAALYDALQRNNFILPPLSDSMCTVHWLTQVFKVEAWCLRTEEVATLKVCPELPNKTELANIVATAMEATPLVGGPFDSGIRLTAALIRKKKPCKQWLVKVLSTVERDHEIFQRTYKRPLVDKKGAAVGNQGVVQNANGFFDGLQVVAKKGKGRYINLLSDQERERLRGIQLQEQADRAAARLSRHKEQLAAH